ncbi:aminotransferase class IV family protein [Aliisedimentitalea scapharcae]|uniref:Probable branched-chain-amino-acid aminotransferase n=1 Tax=Aliisedimentitalea scapharcae TaxID=1524259 RepID=A0ABZ2XWS3_9RHOB
MENPFRQNPDFASDPDFRLIETLGWHPNGIGFRHLDRHLARLQRSALALGLAFDGDAVREVLDTVGGVHALRCRLTLDGQGHTDLTTAALGKTPEDWCLVVAETRLQSCDPWLRHKTTRRALYESTRANLPAGVGEAIFVNENEEVCEGTITNIFLTLANEDRVTPPLACGVLPGILRETLLDSGDFREQVVTLDDLRTARSIAVGNSLRGLIPARFAGGLG